MEAIVVRASAYLNWYVPIISNFGETAIENQIFMTSTLTFVLTSHPCEEAESWLRGKDSTRGEGSDRRVAFHLLRPPSHIT